jgi:hypothetical protein
MEKIYIKIDKASLPLEGQRVVVANEQQKWEALFDAAHNYFVPLCGSLPISAFAVHYWYPVSATSTEKQASYSIFLSGKTTDIDISIARFLFEEVEKRLSKLGHAPVNALQNYTSIDLYNNEESLKNRLTMLLKCEALYLLQDWQDSPASQFERRVAREMNMKIFYQEDNYEINSLR